MTRCYRHWIYLLLHKWYVLLAGVRLGVPLWALIIHDWTKWRRAEWQPYVQHFYDGGAWRERPDARAAVEAAQLMHVTTNPHHWQYWQGREMPHVYVREMLADWESANRVRRRLLPWLGGDAPPSVTAWYAAHSTTITLHPRTRAMVELLLSHMFRPRPASL